GRAPPLPESPVTPPAAANKSGAGEFTRMFQPSGLPPTPSQNEWPQQAQPKKDAGEFTRLLQSMPNPAGQPQGGQKPAQPQHDQDFRYYQTPAPQKPKSANEPGDFTRMFRKPGKPPAPPPGAAPGATGAFSKPQGPPAQVTPPGLPGGTPPGTATGAMAAAMAPPPMTQAPPVQQGPSEY